MKRLIPFIMFAIACSSKPADPEAVVFVKERDTICVAGCQNDYDCWDQCGGSSNTVCVKSGPIGSCHRLTAPPAAPTGGKP